MFFINNFYLFNSHELTEEIDKIFRVQLINLNATLFYTQVIILTKDTKLLPYWKSLVFLVRNPRIYQVSLV